MNFEIDADSREVGTSVKVLLVSKSGHLECKYLVECTTRYVTDWRPLCSFFYRDSHLRTEPIQRRYQSGESVRTPAASRQAATASDQSDLVVVLFI